MANKRGISTIIAFIVVGIPLLVLMGILLFNLMKGSAAFGTKYNQVELLSRTKLCQSQGAISPTAFDNDFGKAQGDLYPDSCDLCLGGNDAADRDADGMPDACDDDPDNPPAKGMTLEKMCKESKGKGTWKNDQCTLKCYKEYMAGKPGAMPCPRI